MRNPIVTGAPMSSGMAALALLNHIATTGWDFLFRRGRARFELSPISHYNQ
jgi:hypothetical protein